MPPTSRDSTTHTVFMGFAHTHTHTKAQMNLNPSKVPKKTATIVANASILTKAINILLFFCCGMSVATPKIHQTARTSRFVVVEGESACKTSDAC